MFVKKKSAMSGCLCSKGRLGCIIACMLCVVVNVSLCVGFSVLFGLFDVCIKCAFVLFVY